MRRLLLILVAVVAGMGLGVEVWHTLAPDATSEWLLPFLSLSYEANLPTWFSSCLLFSCGVLLAAIAHSAGAQRVAWWALSAIFLYMSLDEATELHEHLGGMFGTGGVLYFDWVIPAAVVVAVVGVSFIPFLRSLPPATRNRFIVAGAIYVSGALLTELPLGYWTERAGDDNFTYALIDFVEETLEMVGAGLFLAALWSYRSGDEEAR